MKKKLLFKNSTKYSKKVYNEFNRFHNKEYSFNYDFFTLFMIILLIYCIITTIKARVFPLMFVFICVLIVFVGYRIYNPIKVYKKESNKEAVTEEQVFHFYFYENYFKIRDKLNYDKVFYFNLYRVYETEKYFYLYMDKKYSFIIDKSGFTQGLPEEFSKFIKSKMRLKYKDKQGKQ